MNRLNVRTSSFCIVASTLPVAFLINQLESLRIKKIYVINKNLERAYCILREKTDPSIEIIKVPETLFLQSMFYFCMLVRARFSGVSVLIFHECGMPLVDLLLTWIKPSGYYLPQVTMTGWQEIDFSEFPKGKKATLIRILRVTEYFNYYRSLRIGGKDNEYAVSIKSYPRSIKTMRVDFSRSVLAKRGLSEDWPTDKILFITGKSSASDDCQRKIYCVLIEMALARGYACNIKDHPNPTYRLDFAFEGAATINPSLPAELLDNDYYLVVGLSSSALLSFDDRAISLINLLDDISQEDRNAHIRHFEGALPGNRINYVNSLIEFETLL